MIAKQYVLLAFVVVVALCSESPFLGKITLRPIQEYPQLDNVIEFTPLSQEPKIANFKHNYINLQVLSQQKLCESIPFLDDPDKNVFAIFDGTLILKRKCGTMAKITNIKKAGYKGFLIVTNSDRAAKNHCKMFDSNQFFTGFMDSKNFQLIKDYEAKGKQKVQSFVVKGLLSIELRQTNMKLLQIWVNSLNKKSYETLQYIREAFQELPQMHDDVQWRPRFATFDCTQGEKAKTCQQHSYINSCGCQGKFCSPETREKSAVPMVKQDIRQYFIFKQYGTKYLLYSQRFADECLQIYKKQRFIDECSTKIMNKLNIDSQSINEMVHQFLSSCDEQEYTKEQEVYKSFDRDQQAFLSYRRYPLVLINKQIIQFQNEQELLVKICQNLKLKGDDQNCQTITVGSVKRVQTIVSILFWILLVLILILAAIGVVYFYRKKLKRDVNKQIKMQVSTAVQHYFALTESSTAK